MVEGIAPGDAGPAPRPNVEPLRFEVTLSPQAAGAIGDLGLDVPVVGRVFVIVSRSGEREPRQQVGVTGVPFWGKDVRDFGPGTSAVLQAGDGAVIGYPISLTDLPRGEYQVQAFLNVYTRFERADGRVVEMHLNSGAGQDLWRAPGNAHSVPQSVLLDPAAGGTVRLTLTEVIPPIEPLRPGDVLQQGNPRDTPWVKFVKIRSDLLSEFWGRDMYVGANVLLPRGYQ